MKLRDHIEKINYYVAAVEHGALRRASLAIGIGQPQLTKVIKQLEDLLGTQLIIRSRKGISTTQEGEKLYKEGKKILEDIDKLEFSIQATRINLSGNITIGTYDSISRYFFPDFLKYIKSLHPQLRVNLCTGRSKNLVRMLKDQKLDLAVYVGESKSKYMNSKIVYGDCFNFYNAINFESSFLDTLIYFPDALGDTPVDQLKRGFKSFHQCENLETVVSLSVAGLGVGLLPQRVAREYVLAAKLRENQKKAKKVLEHSISIGLRKNEQSFEVEFIYNELMRFLKIWSER
ncbi:MAG: LysR family transcriptional regulator [Bacteriovoracaceae bacterium]|nr:LysR family transcriptional regulator [Bacteriovoracaceae bacterium]